MVGVADSGLDFSFKGTSHLGITAVGSDVGLFQFEGKDTSELVFASLLLILADEDVEEVLAALLRLCLGLFDGSLDLRVVSVRSGQILDNIGHADLEDDVHTTLQVKSETDLQLFTLLVGVTEIHLFLTQGVEIHLALLLAHLGSLALVVTGDEAEAEIEQADQAKKQCDDFDKYFVLHLVELVFLLCL